ncbi:MAG: hypothetical protein ACRYFK_03150, partial [Janthinobacterium lividum]
MSALIGPNPRVIADDVWAKLLWAGLNLTEDDLPATMFGQRPTFYPLAMVRALSTVWLFTGLRASKIRGGGLSRGEKRIEFMVYTQHLCAKCGSEHIRRNG